MSGTQNRGAGMAQGPSAGSAGEPSTPRGRRVRRGGRRVTGWVARVSGGLQPRPTWLRVAGVLVGALVLAFGWLVAAVLSLASPVGGWLPTAAVLAPGLLLVALAAGLGRWPFAVGLALTTALLLGTTAYRTAPPDHDRLAAVADDAGIPESWELVEEESNGNTWGLWNDLPEVRRSYRTDERAAVAAETLWARLEEEGWELRRDDPGVVGWTYWTRGRWNLDVDVGNGVATVVVHDDY